MLPLIGEVGKSVRAMQTLDIIVRTDHANGATAISELLQCFIPMLLQQIVSYILFMNRNPIFNIISMCVGTEVVVFRKSSRHGQSNAIVVHGSNIGHRERITAVTSVLPRRMSKMLLFACIWQLISLISIAYILDPAIIDLEISPSIWSWTVN